MVPANISGHLLHVKCRAGCGHTREPHGAGERARQTRSRFLVSGLGELMNSMIA